jgi:hypothetical protein
MTTWTRQTVRVYQNTNADTLRNRALQFRSDQTTRIQQGIPGFATIHYDNEPSPLTVLGGGTNSIFGPGGVVDGIGSVIRNVQSGNILGAILGASNTYNNAKKIKKSGVKEELKGIAKDGILEVGKQAGSITNPVAAFTVGSGTCGGNHSVCQGNVRQQNKTKQHSDHQSHTGHGEFPRCQRSIQSSDNRH